MRADDFVGIPFKANGSDWDGCDCFGLVRLYYREKYGLDIPRLAFPEKIEKSADIHHLLPKNWHEVDVPVVDDVLLLRPLTPAYPAHVGIYVGHNLMLHVTEGRTSCIVPILYNYRARILGFFRWIV